MCKQQQPVVDRLSTDAKFAKVAVFRADFDASKDLLRDLKVSKQGTLIAFKGKRETARSTGDTDEKAVRKIFEAAV